MPRHLLLISDNVDYQQSFEKDVVLQVSSQDIDFTNSNWITELKNLLDKNSLLFKLDTILINYSKDSFSAARNEQLTVKLFQTLHTIYKDIEVKIIVVLASLDETSILTRAFLYTTRTTTRVKSVLTNKNPYSNNFEDTLSYCLNSNSKSLVLLEEGETV
jgi:hypothetical protein